VRFLLDENAEARIAAFLLGRGHDATRVGHDYPAGLPDEAVLALAYEESRVLITNDRDFGELVVRERRPHAGVILVRFPRIVRRRGRSRRWKSSWLRIHGLR
jgi:predicted nuclease of predicted toxin-antitoxin system